MTPTSTPSHSFQYDLVCIGSGPAGQRAAIQAAKICKRVALIEKRRVMGGTCLDTATIPSKTFREAVLSFSGLNFRWLFNQQAHPPRPSMDQLIGRVTEVIQIEGEVLHDQLRRNDVRLIQGQAAFRNDHTLELHNEQGISTITADKILIAVGTRPTAPPGVALDDETILDSDSILQLKRLPRSLTVVGAGVIGLEYASMFGILGVEVTLVDTRTRPLEFLDGEIVDELIHQMRNHQVTFRLGETVESLERVKEPRPRAIIHLASGKRLVSDAVLYSIGRTGATDA